MKKNHILVMVVLLLMGGGISAAFFSKTPEMKVLVFSKTEGFRHASISAGKQALLSMAAQHGFVADTTEDASWFNEPTLSRYHVVIFLNTTGDVLDDAQQVAFSRWVQAGGGFVGIHAAADTEYDWPWYGQLVGGYFNGHPNNPNVREGAVDKVEADNPSVSHLPDRWVRNDEWYNYRNLVSGIKVILNLDEQSYEGGTNGDHHPITWYREFDGGRTWYTGMGHTSESFEDPDYLQHIWEGIKYAAGSVQRVDYQRPTVMPEENRFTKKILDENLNEPMELAVLPGQDILFIERKGAIKYYDRQAGKVDVITQMPVHTVHEDGLLGLALDPDYENNHWIYLFYSPKGDLPKQHVSRFVFKDRELDMNSEKVLLEIPTQRDECCHSAGSLEFGPEGLLYISVGDNTNPHASDGFSPSDERPGRSPWDAQKSSANTQDLRGKVLRIRPLPDGTYEIPDGNLFPKDGSEGRPEIYVMGCRNPFRISIDDHSGYLYWGDVGPDAGEDSQDRGPRGHDEVNQARKPGFFGWPYFVADNKAYHDYDFDAKQSGPAYDPQKPLNASPNNTGARVLPPAQKAFIYYPYAASGEFPLVGEGGRNAMAGPVFHLGDFPASSQRFPAYYDGKLFTYDWMRGWIMAVTMNEQGDFVMMERFLPSMKFNNPVDMTLGPDGDLYLLEYGTNWFRQNEDARLVHIQYTAGNRRPVATFSVSQQYGAAPMEMVFDPAGTMDFDGDELKYSWKLNGESFSEARMPSLTLETPGTYTVELVVIDPSGETSTHEQSLYVGNALPEVKWTFEGNRSFFFDQGELEYEVQVNDPEDGTIGHGIDPEAVTVSIQYLPTGMDKNMIAMGHEAQSEAAQVIVGRQMIAQSDCKACHQMDQASVGPTYQAIAEKYKGDPKALTYLAEKVLKGGTGNWGALAMAAHPQHTQEEAEQMVKYILSVNDHSHMSGSLPVKGTYAFDQHQPGDTRGSYILTASYIDRGGKEIGPLSDQQTYVLRYPKIEAETYDATNTAMKFEITPGMVPGVEEAFEIVMGNDQSYIQFKEIDLTGIRSISLMAGANSMYFDGGIIEARLGSPEGDLLGFAEVEATQSMGAGVKSMNIAPTSGMHDLYFVFKAKGEPEKNGIAFIDSIIFSGQPVD